MTWKPDLRWAQHLSGFGSKYTTKHGVKKLVYLEEHENLEEARRCRGSIAWNTPLVRYGYAIHIKSAYRARPHGSGAHGSKRT